LHQLIVTITMPFNFDNSVHLPWESSTMDRRGSINSRRNSLLSLSLFDVPLFGSNIGGGGIGGGTGSNRNSLGLGSSMYGLGDSDPFAPLAYNDLSIIPFSSNELQQMQVIHTQNNINNLNALLNINNGGNNFNGNTYSSNSNNNRGNNRNSLGFGSNHNNSRGFSNHQMPNITSALLDRLLGDRSESSGESVPSMVTASTYGSSSGSSGASINSNNSVLMNHHRDNNGSVSLFNSSLFQQQQHRMNPHQQGHHQQQQQQQYHRSNSNVLDHYPRHVPIKAHGGHNATSPDQPPSKVIASSEDDLGLSPFSPLTPHKKSVVHDSEQLVQMHQQKNSRSSPCPPSKLSSSSSNNTTNRINPSMSDDIDDDDEGDYDDDDDDENNLNRFKPFHEEKWSLRYKELLEFHKEHGHAAVPHTYPPNPQLARWVKRQRRQFKLRKENRQSTMTSERLDLLNNVGFIWDSHDVNWREKLDTLTQFKKEHCHCNVPSNYRDKKLATWVKCQRRQFKLYWDGKPSAMTPDRIMELEKVGFEWEIRSTVPRAIVPSSSTSIHNNSSSRGGGGGVSSSNSICSEPNSSPPESMINPVPSNENDFDVLYSNIVRDAI
jgi:Helicase associated domain